MRSEEPKPSPFRCPPKLYTLHDNNSWIRKCEHPETGIALLSETHTQHPDQRWGVRKKRFVPLPTFLAFILFSRGCTRKNMGVRVGSIAARGAAPRHKGGAETDERGTLEASP